MGIHSEIDPLDEADIDDLLAADALLAEALAKFAKEKFREANRKNKDIAGTWVPYQVIVDGKPIYEGRGEIFPENQVSTILREKTRRERNVEFGRKVVEIVVDWLFRKLGAKAMEIVVRRLMKFGANYYARSSIATKLDLPGSATAARTGYNLLTGGTEDGPDERRRRRDDVLRWIAGELIRRSPVVSGDYQASHDLYVDGRLELSAEMVRAGDDVPEGVVYAFANQAAYARKLETGKVQAGRRKGQAFVKQVPPHIYERVATNARGRFGNQAAIAFNYTALDEHSFDANRLQRRSKSRYELLFPIITIVFR